MKLFKHPIKVTYLTGLIVALFVAFVSVGIVIYLIIELYQFQLATSSFLREASVQIDQLTNSNTGNTIRITGPITISAEIPVNQSLSIPAKFQINEVIPVKTTLPINAQIKVPVSTKIPVDQQFDVSLSVLGQNIQVPLRIKGVLPVDFTLDVPFKQDVPLSVDIPINMPIESEFSFDLKQPISVRGPVTMDMEFPVTLSMKGSTLSSELQVLADDLSNLPNPRIVVAVILILLTISILAILFLLSWLQRNNINFADKLLPDEYIGYDPSPKNLP